MTSQRRYPVSTSASAASRPILGGAIALLAMVSGLAVSSPAHACPPGHYGIGGGTAGWVGCAPMDGGVGQSESPASVERFNVTAPGLSNYDASQWSSFLGDLAAGTIASEREALRPDQRPIYDELIRGFWVFGTSRESAPVPMCTASFWYRRIFLGGGSNGGFMYMDWGGSEPGTMLAFFDQQIPTVRQVGRVRVQLVQDGETQEVEAFHTTYPGSRSMGMIIMRVPSLQALLSAIQDDGSIELKMDERELTQSRVLITRWRQQRRAPTGIYHKVTGTDFRDGLSAREALTTCLRQQGRPS